MVAISGTLSGGGTSALFTPTENVCDVIIKARKGSVSLEAIAPAGPDPVMVSNQSGAYEVLTADAAVTYHFVGSHDCDADYYMGP